MKLRRSMLFIPGNNPGLIRDVHIYRPDSIMLDLEDAIAITEKDSARFLTHNMLKQFKNLYKELGIETVVRINALDTEFWRDDIKAVVSAGVDVIRIPKTETVEDVLAVEKQVEECEKEYGLEIGSTKIMVAIESAVGVMNCYPIAKSSNRLIGMALSAEDFVTSLRTQRSADGEELRAARGMIVLAAKAANIAALDTVYSDVNNEEGFLKEAKFIKQLGFDGKSLIHPKQVELVHSVYTPSESDIKKSLKIVNATKQALKENKGVFTVDGKMVDKPIIERAEHILSLAKASKVNIGGEY